MYHCTGVHWDEKFSSHWIEQNIAFMRIPPKPSLQSTIESTAQQAHQALQQRMLSLVGAVNWDQIPLAAIEIKIH